MRKFLSLVVLGALIMNSCEEIGPKIDFGPGIQKGEDTTYKTTTVETPQQKIVLFEDFTGVSCPPCPGATTLLNTIKSNNNDNVIVIGYHAPAFPQTVPVEKDGVMISKYDFRTQDASDVLNFIDLNPSGIPIGAIDRTDFGNGKLVDKGFWSDGVTNRIAKTVPVNIHLSSAFDDGSREATVIVRLAYTSNVTTKQNINLVIFEDGIVDAQKDGLAIVKDYEHNHVMRDVFTPINGAPIPVKVDPKEAGTVYERTFKVPIHADWKADKCHVVVFVTNDEAGDKSVVQAAEVKVVNP